MKNKYIIIAFTFSLLALPLYAAQPLILTPGYGPNKKIVGEKTADLLLQKRMCNTDCSDTTKKVADKYRKWAFQALKRMGHAEPHIVMVLREISTANAHAGPIPICAKTHVVGRGITIDTEHHDKYAYGAQRLVTFHEAAHLAERHYAQFLAKDNKKYYEHSRNLERTADELAAQHGRCYHCTQEYGHYRLKRAISQHTRGEIVVAQHQESIIQMNITQLDALIAQAQKENNDADPQCTHPSDHERALRMFKIARNQKQAKSVCSHHQKKEMLLIAQEQAAEKKRIAQIKKEEKQAKIKQMQQKAQKKTEAKNIEIKRIAQELRKKIHPSIKGICKFINFEEQAKEEYEKRHGNKAVVLIEPESHVAIGGKIF